MKTRLAAKLTIVILASLFTLLGAAVWWIGTDWGRAWLTEQVSNASGGALAIEGLSGHPLHRLKAASINFSDETTEVSIGRFEISWDVWSLFAGRIHIQSISAGQIHVRQIPGEATPSQPAAIPFGLLSRLRMDLARIDAISLTGPDDKSATQVRNIRLAELAFAPGFSGRLAFEAEEQSLDLQLSGAAANWLLQASAAPLQLSRPAITASIRGEHLDRGAIRLVLQATQGTLEMSGQWTHDLSAAQAQGTIESNIPPLDIKASWTGTADNDFSHTHLALDGSIDSDAILNRALRITASADMDDTGFHGKFGESEGLQAIWHTEPEGRIVTEATLQRWDVPLARAHGSLTGDFHASADPADLDWSVNADIREGAMAGVSARLNIDASGQGESWKLNHGIADLLGIKIDATGSGESDKVNFAGHAISKDIGPLLAVFDIGKARGSLFADFGLRGEIDDPRLEWKAGLQGLDVPGLHLSRLESEGKFSPSTYDGEADVQASMIDFGDWHWDTGQLHARRDGQDLSLAAHGKGDMDWELALSGKRQNAHTWAGQLARLLLTHNDRELIAMHERDWKWQAGDLLLPEGNLAIAGQSGTLGLAIKEEGLSGSLLMPDFEAHAIEPWLQPQVRDINGRLGLRLSLAGAWQAPSLSAEVQSSDLHFSLAEAEKHAPPLHFSVSQAAASYADGHWTWDAHGQADEVGRLASSGTLPWQWQLQPWTFAAVEDQGGQAQLSLHIERLDAFAPMLPLLDPLAGNAMVDIVILEPFGSTSSKGSTHIALAAAGFPDFGLDMRGDIKADWQGNEGNLAIDIRAGEGSLAMAGPVTWPLTESPALLLHNFPLIQLPEQNITVDGKLEMLHREHIATLKGELLASPLRITIPEILPVATDDLIWHGDEEEKTETPIGRTQLDVALSLGEAAEIRGRGMSLTVAGQLQLGGSISKPLLTGELRIPAGSVDFRSIHLDLAPSSRVIFTGSIERPLIDIEAVRKIDEITVGVHIQGPVDKLETRLISNPAMPDVEIMAYLATGRPLATLGKDNAADAMTLAGFLMGPSTASQDIQNKLQRALGLDSLEVEAGLESGKVAAGKKLSKRVTVRIEETIATETTTAVTLEYLLRKHITIFATQVQNMAPVLGLRLRKEWGGVTP